MLVKMGEANMEIAACSSWSTLPPNLTFTLYNRCLAVSGPQVGAAWDQGAASASGDSLAEATMGQTLFFVWLPSLIKLSRGVIGF